MASTETSCPAASDVASELTISTRAIAETTGTTGTGSGYCTLLLSTARMYESTGTAMTTTNSWPDDGFGVDTISMTNGFRWTK
jgi:hypothetical protein